MNSILDGIVSVVKEASLIMLEARAIESTRESKEGHANFVTAYDKKVQDFLFTNLKQVVKEAVEEFFALFNE